MAKEFEALQRGDIPGGGQWTDAAWLRGPSAQAFLALLGSEKDAAMAELRAAVKARWPGLGPADALHFQGQGFDIERFAGESDELYDARLQRAWETHRLAGTASAIVESLHAYGITDVAIVEDWEGHFAPGDWYSRFWVVLGPDFGTLALKPLAMPFSLGEVTLGTTATVDQVHAIKRQVLKWKDTHGYPVGVILRFGDAPVLGMDLVMPFVLDGSPGSGFAVWAMGSTHLLGEMSMPFTLGCGYEI
jgi:hypothetical protein